MINPADQTIIVWRMWREHDRALAILDELGDDIRAALPNNCQWAQPAAKLLEVAQLICSMRLNGQELVQLIERADQDD